MKESVRTSLWQYIQGTIALPEPVFNEFARDWEPFTAKRREILTHPGTTERYLYFVISGAQRLLAHSEEREATLLFSYPPSFGGVLDSLLRQHPSAYTYETLTASSFIRLPAPRLAELTAQHPEVQQLIQIGLAGALSGLLERLTELQVAPAEQRFRNLLRRSPHILQQVPHKYLANYIGIDPSNFSKFLNAIRIE